MGHDRMWPPGDDHQVHGSGGRGVGRGGGKGRGHDMGLSSVR